MSDDSTGNPDDLAELFAAREQEVDKQEEAPDGHASGASSVDATCLFQEGEFDKKQEDVAFAVAGLESGAITERQLTKAVKDWTVHGDTSLADHLVAKTLITAQSRVKLEQRAHEILQRASTRASTAVRRPGESTFSAILDQLDSSGKVGRILGLTAANQIESGALHRNVATSYRLLRRLGQGGMGTVWLARDEKLGRLVAVKEIRAGAKHSQSTRSRFRREAQVTGRLEHPSIVPVHQFAEDSETVDAFYVMRFLGKRTLEDAIAEYHERRESGDDDPMHLHHLLTAFVTVCQAIAYAHSRHVVHRDLKPENIALDDYGQVIVLDWGLAKLTGRAEQHELLGDLELNDLASPADQTTMGQVLGTPMYMAPEQAAGRVDEIDPTTDVYGLGAILFTILTGVAAHESTRESLSTSSAVNELLQAIVSRPPPQATEINPDAPPQLAAICRKAMASRQYARYATAMDLAEDVQRWMAGEPVSTYTDPWRKRMWRWMNTHRRTSQFTGVVATVVVVLAVTLAITSQQNRLAARQSRFESLKADARELQVSLESIADDLVQNGRFMAALPPIQGIIDARDGSETDEEGVWMERLQTIYRGLLEANPDYLSATYAGGESLGEIVRVERQETGSFVRTVPSGRLASLEMSDALEQVVTRKPGDVSIVAERAIHEVEAATSSDRLVLTAAVPVYNQTDGDLFGVVLIEADLENTVRDLLTVVIDAGENAYIVDALGQVVLHYSNDGDFRRATVGQNVGDLVEGTAGLFSSSVAADNISVDQRVYGVRMELDPRHGSARLGFILAIDD